MPPLHPAQIILLPLLLFFVPVLAILLIAWILHATTRWLGFPRISYARAVGAVLLGAFLSLMASLVMGRVLWAGIAGFLIDLVIFSIAISLIYDVGIGKAFVAAFITWILLVLVAVAIAILLAIPLMPAIYAPPIPPIRSA